MRKKVELVLMIGFILFLIIYYWNQNQDKKAILNKSGETIGTLVDYYVVFPQSHYLVYQYKIANVTFRKKINTEKIFKNCNEDRKCLGLKFLVLYEIGNPKNSMIKLDEPR